MLGTAPEAQSSLACNTLPKTSGRTSASTNRKRRSGIVSPPCVHLCFNRIYYNTESTVMQAFWGKFPAFSLQVMQFDGLPLLIHRCFCVKTAVFITQTKVPRLFDSQGTLCLSVFVFTRWVRWWCRHPGHPRQRPGPGRHRGHPSKLHSCCRACYPRYSSQWHRRRR